MALYTPFMEKVGKTLGASMARTGRSELAGSAYMGNPNAMQELMRVDPDLGIQIQERKRTEQQQKLQGQRQEQAAGQKKEQSQRKIYMENREVMDGIFKEAAKFDDFKQAKSHIDRRFSENAELLADHADTSGFTPKVFQQLKKVFDDKPEVNGGAFGGTSMDAQVSNMLSKGVEDPKFRESPDYARAWELANEPKVIRTPTGDILLRPELSAVFKPPGKEKPEKEQIAISKKGVKKDVEIIPGTEKEMKTTADEKISFGYYNRMTESEKNLEKLGDFNSADIWERLKGVTNITASPELQQYRQAADDWIRAKLRRESGAVIAADEMQKEYEIYFPQIGDSQAVIDQKASARKTAESAMQTAAGKEYKKAQKTDNGGPDIGTTSKGYRFIGGDPAKKESWTKI